MQKLATVAPRKGRADDEVTVAIAREKACKSRQQGHEESRVGAATPGSESRAVVAGEMKSLTTPGECRCLAACPVGRQIDLQGAASQAAHLRFDPLRREISIAVPTGIVTVLHGEIRGGSSIVDLCELPHPDAKRRLVPDQMVDGKEQNVLLPAQAKEKESPQRRAAQIEASTVLDQDEAPHLLAGVGRENPRQIGKIDAQRDVFGDMLVRDPVSHGKARAQNLMAAHDLTERGVPSGVIEATEDLERQRRVIGGGIAEKMPVEPDSLLRVGQASRGMRDAGDRRLAGGSERAAHRVPKPMAAHFPISMRSRSREVGLL